MRKNSFLYRVAEDIGKRYGGRMKDLTVVFPSRRSGRVFQHHLINQAQAPVWSPEIRTIDELFKSCSQLTEADPLTLVTMLHESWNEVTGLDEPFEKFYFFGKMMLGDFDLIDKYRITPANIFRHIKDIKEIEEQFQLTEEDSEAFRELKKYFQTERAPNSPGGEFLKSWTSLLPVYHSLKNRLEEEDLAWPGTIYREVASQPERLSKKAKGKYIFCGFNRINRCEQAVFNHLRDTGLAEFYWKDDPLIREDYRQEAGKFLVQNLKNYPPVTPLATNMKADEKEINIIPVNFQSLQVQVVTQLMKEASVEDGKTGLILNDEDILLPLLSSLPENGLKINVSAGLNLIKTPVYDLIRTVIELHENAERNKGDFHYRDIEQVFFNPLLPHFYQKWLNEVKITNEDGKPDDRRSQVFFSLSELSQMEIDELVPKIFKAVKNPVDVVQLLLEVLKDVFEINKEERDEESDTEELTGMYSELIAEAHKVLMRLRETLPAWSKAIQYPLLRNIIRDIAQNRRIPFKGEPLRGIQITGALEARNLGFDHLILPSMNEGIQPAGPRQSLIPFSLKKYFGLPTTEDEMAEQSYYFRSLIAGAKKIDIIYDESVSGMRKNEPSRFVQQLIYGDLPNWKIGSGKKLQIPIDNNMPQPIKVPRTPEIQRDLLNQLKERGLSPSRFLDFLTCELRFYFSYILGADEKEMVPEEVDARVQGNILHRVLENLYRNYKDSEVTADHIDLLLKKLPSEVEKVLREERKLGNKRMAGHDLVAKRYIEKMVRKVLVFDKQRAPFIIRDHEKRINLELEFDGHPVKFTGFVDRIHETNEGLHIVDYKTGSDASTASKAKIYPIPGNDQEKAGDLNRAFIQTLTYCWLLGQEDPSYQNRELIPEIYTTRALGSNYNPVLKLKEPRAREEEMLTTSHEFYGPFVEQLKESVGRLLDGERPFLQAKDERVCKYCVFRNICMRGGSEW